MVRQDGGKFITAHYFKSGKNHNLVLSQENRPVGKTVIVASKKQARQVAAEHSAKCWNF